MARLRRVGDNEGFSGSVVTSIYWNKDGTLKEEVKGGPFVGSSIKVGSVTAGTYSTRDWWMTTPIIEILEERKNKDGLLEYAKFRTENSIYEITA